MTNTPSWSVYLMRDSDGVLLYVGVTSRGHARQAEHMATRTWAPEVATTHWEHLATREAALRREQELIRNERPKHNVVHSGQRLREMDPDARAEWTAVLRDLGARRSALRRELAAISEEVVAAARDAYADGMGKSEIARLAQISRPALDTMLKAH